MKRITLITVILISVLTGACDKKHEPSPDEKIHSMSVSVRKVNDQVQLDITALTFKNSSGPEATTFEQAEVWVSEGVSGLSNLKLVTTTTEKTVKLENLQPEKTYYVAVKGLKNGVKSDYSKPIMFTTNSLKPVQTLLELNFGWFMSGSDKNPYLAYVDDNTGEVILQNWQDKSKKVIFKNSASKTYMIKGFYSEGTMLILETTRNRERAYDYYDLTTEKFLEIPMPEGARIWNCAFSPDGFRMAYTDYNQTGLYIYDIVLKQSRKYSDSFFYDFNWSVDGKSIIQLRNKPNVNSDAREIVKWDLADSNKAPELLFEWPDVIQWMSFSPTDNYVLFSSYVSNNADLWIYDLKTRKTWQISDVSNFGWLSDKEFFVNANKLPNETSWKTYKYTMP